MTSDRKIEQMRVGSQVYVRGGFGTEPARLAEVTELAADIKNGRPGIGYTEIDSGDDRWAYLDQVIAVTKW